MSRQLVTLLAVTAVLMVSSVALAAATPDNPCNPCSMKKGTVFNVQDAKGRNTVSFKSEAPLEDIVGTTNQVTGMIVFDPAHPEKGGHAMFAVAASTFNTGIPLRDEHLRGADWLDTGKHSEITLKITKISNVKETQASAGSATYEFDAVGELTLRGKTQTVSFPARITHLKESELTKRKMPGDLLAARASFDVALADFGIAGPKGMDLVGTKVGETIRIDVSLMGSNAGASMAANPCNPCGKTAKAANPCNPCGK